MEREWQMPKGKGVKLFVGGNKMTTNSKRERRLVQYSIVRKIHIRQRHISRVNSHSCRNTNNLKYNIIFSSIFFLILARNYAMILK